MHISASWNKAIQIRHSRRKYLAQPVSTDTLQKLQTFCQEYRPFANAAYGVLVTKTADDFFKGIVGSYGKVTGAPAYIAFVGKTTAPHVDEKVGYVGEGIILEATALGLSSCWVSGLFKRDAVQRHLTLAEDECVYAITPLGYTSEHYTLDEKLMSAMAKSRQRKELQQLCTGLAERDWTDWQRTALHAARIAPSAMNRQPWQFIVGEGEITIVVDQPKDLDKDRSRRLDCGIALLHLQAGAEQAGKKYEVHFLNHPEVARITVYDPVQ